MRSLELSDGNLFNQGVQDLGPDDYVRFPGSKRFRFFRTGTNVELSPIKYMYPEDALEVDERYTDNSFEDCGELLIWRDGYNQDDPLIFLWLGGPSSNIRTEIQQRMGRDLTIKILKDLELDFFGKKGIIMHFVVLPQNEQISNVPMHVTDYY